MSDSYGTGPDPVFYYRDGCHLCEQMYAALCQGWPDVAGRVEWRNVDHAPEWQAAYGLTLPVLQLDGRVVCTTFIDESKLIEYFGAPANLL